MQPSDAARELVLAFADDELCVGQNHAWWIAIGPFLEEDLAFTSIAQDELGHARSLYGLITDDVDDLAYGRKYSEYRSAHIAEMLCHDWSWALVRHLLHDTAEQVRWRSLLGSTWSELGDVAQRCLAEEQFHKDHALSLAERLLSSDEGNSHLKPVFVELAPLAREYFVGPDEELLATGVISVSKAEQQRLWLKELNEFFEPYKIELSMEDDAPSDGRSGVRSDDFSLLHDEMTAVLMIDPLAKW